MPCWELAETNRDCLQARCGGARARPARFRCLRADDQRTLGSWRTSGVHRIGPRARRAGKSDALETSTHQASSILPASSWQRLNNRPPWRSVPPPSTGTGNTSSSEVDPLSDRSEARSRRDAREVPHGAQAGQDGSTPESRQSGARSASAAASSLWLSPTSRGDRESEGEPLIPTRCMRAGLSKPPRVRRWPWLARSRSLCMRR